MSRAYWSVGLALGIVALGGTLSTLKEQNADAQMVAVSPSAGPQGATGATGPAGSSANSFGSPNARTLSLATAYQATDNTKPAMVNINITSTANFSLSGGTTNTATVVMGSTSAVASGTGTAICSYNNSNTGTIAVGLNQNTAQGTTCSFALPPGWYWAVRQTGGTVTITSAFDSAVG